MRKVPHRKSTQTSHFHLPINRDFSQPKWGLLSPSQLAPSPIRPRRLSFTPHSAMPTEDSHNAQHYPPPEGPSQKRPSAEVNLQAEVELLRASVIKMSEKCDHLLSKNVELEHDYRTLKRNWEKNQAQGSQRSLTREQTTKSRHLRISPPRDRPHEPTKVYRDCRDRILDRQGKPIHISVDLQDPKVTHLGPPEKPTQLPPGEGLGDSENWGQDYLEDYESYHTEAFEELYPAHGHPHTRPPAHGTLPHETLPHADPAMRLLFEKVRRLESEQQRAHQPLWAKPRPGPFTERILNYHQEKEIQPLRIAFYTGTEDPLTHIHSFQSALGCKGLTDEGMCLIFPSTLSGAALNWFYRLNPCTINTFDSLKQAFLDHFMIQTDRLYSADDLYMLRQGEDEPLREYAARFSHEYSRCPDTDDRAAFGAFKSGLRESNFRYLVHSNPWNTYAELMKQAARGRHGNHHQSSIGNPHGTGDRGDRAPLPFSPKPRYEVFTTLNTTYENLLVHEAPIIPKPPPRRPGSKPMPNTGVFCRFHQFSGHDTESCVALRNIIEGLIREGKLDKYVHNLPPQPNPHQRQINMISTISGGPTLAGTSNNSIKHYVRSTYAHQVFSAEQGRLPKTHKSGWAPITFCEEEERGVILPHDDPIIIRADISNCDVGRILVDTGSSVSVMFAEAFNELQPIGSIHLPISIGAAPQRRTITTPFLIIDCPTAYNVILGRPAMAQMKVFISTHMLLLKFPTPYGTGTVRGDQLGARSCYASAVKSTNRQHRGEALAVTQAPAPPRAGTERPEDPREESVTQQAEPVEDLELVTLDEDIPDRQVRIGTSLSQELRSDLIAFLRLNSEKRRAYDPERYEAMKAEVDKLSTIGFIKEVDYPTWLANVQYKMRLNPTKCAFGVASGKFLGFMISQRGIEANPEKIQAILDMAIPKTVKDIQSLTGRVAALTRFISKATDRCAPFFKALKGSKRSITWTAECDKAFSELKEYMSRAPLLSTPEPGDTLMVYLSISATAVSSVLIQTKEGAEHPVHYVSKALQDAEARYPDIEKLAFALVVSARRLRPYFQAHTIHVLTNHPLRQVLQKPETSGRLVKWAIELGEFDIHYKPRPATKGQAVADFISEFTEPSTVASSQITIEPTPTSSQIHVAGNGTANLTQPLWTLYVDGSSNAQGCGAGLVLISPDKVVLEYALRFKFHASNNEAEYEALLAGLRLAKEMGARQIQIFSDSQLVVHQVNQNFTAKDVSMTAYLQHTRHLLTTFNAYLISQVPRSENSHADALARLASAIEQGIGRNIHMEILDQPSTRAPLICAIDHSLTWMDPILQFLQNQTLPADPAEARRVRYRSARYLILNGALYKRGFSLPYLRCLTPEEGNYVLKEIHGGICGSHLGARSLAHKAIRQGYFWPSLHTDAQAFTQKCDKLG
ncbi:unnamed protein product [Prunus brigantina]